MFEKGAFYLIFPYFLLAEYSADWPNISAELAENFGRIFGFGRTLIIIYILASQIAHI